MQEAMQRGAIHSLGDVANRHADFVAVRDGMVRLRATLDQRLAAAEAAHAALHQPDDLKPVYDKAYERDVTVPATAFAEIFPDLAEALNTIVAFGDFVDQQHAEVKFNGPLIQTSNPALEPQLKTLVKTLNDKSEAIAKAQQRMRAIVTGSERISIRLNRPRRHDWKLL